MGSDQLHLYESAPATGEVVLASAWGGPGSAGGTDQSEAWRDAAVRIVACSYDGDGDHNATTLLPDVSSGNLRLLLGLRVGRRVHADVHPSILANVGWLLDAVDGADFAAPAIVDELQREVRFVGHTALLALRVWTAESSAESTVLILAAALEQTSLCHQIWWLNLQSCLPRLRVELLCWR